MKLNTKINSDFNSDATSGSAKPIVAPRAIIQGN